MARYVRHPAIAGSRIINYDTEKVTFVNEREEKTHTVVMDKYEFIHNVINKTKKTAHLSDNEIVTVTHPLLPNSGKQYFLIARLNPQRKERLLCQDQDGNEVLTQIGYTDFKEQDFFQEQANGLCDFHLIMLQTDKLKRKIRNININLATGRNHKANIYQ